MVIKLKTLSIIFFIISAGLFYWQKNNTKNSLISKINEPVEVIKKSIEQKKNDSLAPLKDSSIGDQELTAMTKIEINPNNGQEEVKIMIPKGKRLYDEEKMKEISSDANIESITH